MKLVALGLSHQTAQASLRESLAFDGPRRLEGLQQLKAEFPGSEFVILSTCNRVELYAAGLDQTRIPDLDQLTEFLERFHGIDPEHLASHLVRYVDEGVVGHLFRVTASLESLVLGEGQILSQVKEAYEVARGQRAVGSILNPVFQHALHVGKKVREQTGLDQGRVSVASVAVEVAEGVFDQFDDKTVLVLGAGKMAELTLQHLKPLGPGRIVIANRSADRARETAMRWDGEARTFDQLQEALVEADLVISTTASEHPIVTKARYAEVQRRRKHRLALILDIAIPRDFEDGVGDLDQVWLYNVDDLQAQADRNRRSRKRCVDQAQAIIDHETEVILRKIHHQHHAGVVIRNLTDYLDEVFQREQDWLLTKNPDLQDNREQIQHMLHRIKNKILHEPRIALRAAADSPESESDARQLLKALQHLFKLDDAATNGAPKP